MFILTKPLICDLKQRSSSKSVDYYVHLSTQFLQTNDPVFKFFDDFLAGSYGQEGSLHWKSYLERVLTLSKRLKIQDLYMNSFES